MTDYALEDNIKEKIDNIFAESKRNYSTKFRNAAEYLKHNQDSLSMQETRDFAANYLNQKLQDYVHKNRSQTKTADYASKLGSTVDEINDLFNYDGEGSELAKAMSKAKNNDENAGKNRVFIEKDNQGYNVSYTNSTGKTSNDVVNRFYRTNPNEEAPQVTEQNSTAYHTGAQSSAYKTKPRKVYASDVERVTDISELLDGEVIDVKPTYKSASKDAPDYQAAAYDSNGAIPLNGVEETVQKAFDFKEADYMNSEQSHDVAGNSKGKGKSKRPLWQKVTAAAASLVCTFGLAYNSFFGNFAQAQDTTCSENIAEVYRNQGYGPATRLAQACANASEGNQTIPDSGEKTSSTVEPKTSNSTETSKDIPLYKQTNLESEKDLEGKVNVTHTQFTQEGQTQEGQHSEYFKSQWFGLRIDNDKFRVHTTNDFPNSENAYIFGQKKNGGVVILNPDEAYDKNDYEAVGAGMLIKNKDKEGYTRVWRTSVRVDEDKPAAEKPEQKPQDEKKTEKKTKDYDSTWQDSGNAMRVNQPSS